MRESERYLERDRRWSALHGQGRDTALPGAGGIESRSIAATVTDFLEDFRAVATIGMTARSLNLPYSHITYWMTSSARPSSDGGIVSPRALAVLRLITGLFIGACNFSISSKVRRSGSEGPISVPDQGAASVDFHQEK
jgi:hypothetical protein